MTACYGSVAGALCSRPCTMQEAAEAIKPILGKYYNYDSRNVFSAMWQDWHVCCYVAPDAKGGEVLWFRQ